MNKYDDKSRYHESMFQAVTYFSCIITT